MRLNLNMCIRVLSDLCIRRPYRQAHWKARSLGRLGPHRIRSFSSMFRLDRMLPVRRQCEDKIDVGIKISYIVCLPTAE